MPMDRLRTAPANKEQVVHKEKKRRLRALGFG